MRGSGEHKKQPSVSCANQKRKNLYTERYMVDGFTVFRSTIRETAIAKLLKTENYKHESTF